MSEWKPMESAPKDRPFLALKWWRDWSNEGVGGSWKIMGEFKRENAPPHDKDVFAVSANRQFWLRQTTWGNGEVELDSWRWVEIPPLPPALEMKTLPVAVEA
jgi:hypothetical protein